MSAKLLYSLSDENKDLQKQIGCMNGFLQFFERRHVITNQGENHQEGREANGTSKRSKEKHHKVVKEKQANPTEPSRASVSSSAGSTLSSQEYDWATKPENPPFQEPTVTDTLSRDSKTNRTFSSPNSSHRFPMKSVVIDSISTIGSPITTPKRGQVVRTKHIDSPRLSSLNESFRSISSNHSAPVTPLSRKDAPRLSYDGTETRETFVSGLKVRDLPRLSLDSRQRTISKSGKTQNLPEEPGSYRAPSNIVAKLMGLEALSDSGSTYQSPVCASRLDSLSRSSRTIDESKVKRALNSPRNKCKDPRTPQSNDVVLVRELEVSSPRISTENSEPGNHSSVTVYGEIERRLADIDFKKSGKDLRALKQILEAIHREKKAILERRNENSSFDSAPQISSESSTYTNQSQGPQRENQQNIKSPRSVKKDKFVRGSRKEPGPKACNVALERVHGVGVSQPVSTTRKISVDDKTAKDPTPKPNRGLKASKVKPRHITEVNVKTSGKIPESLSTKTSSSRTKKHNQLTMRSHCRNQKPSQNSNEICSKSACPIQEENAYSWLPESNSCFSKIDKVITSIDQSHVKYDALREANDNKHPEGAPSDGSFRKLTISIQEQPSPVSVLDSAFYGDESPSPVRKKPTAFQGFYADDESTDTTTEAEWKEKDFTYSPYSSMRQYDTNYRELENFKGSSQTLLNQQDENITMPLHKEANLEKAYVAEILLASGFVDNLNFANIINHCAPQLKEPINPNLFFILERTKASRSPSNSKPNNGSKANTRTHDKHRRKLLFDVVNEIVSQKMSFRGVGSQLRTGQQLLQEIYKEINQLEVKSSNQSLDDEDEDFLTTIIEKDLTHRSGNWTDNHISSETSGLVLDIERLIFKDLIVELIHDEASQERVRNQGCSK